MPLAEPVEGACPGLSTGPAVAPAPVVRGHDPVAVLERTGARRDDARAALEAGRDLDGLAVADADFHRHELRRQHVARLALPPRVPSALAAGAATKTPVLPARSTSALRGTVIASLRVLIVSCTREYMPGFRR